MSEELDATEPNRFLSSIAARLPPLETGGGLSELLGQSAGAGPSDHPGDTGTSQTDESETSLAAQPSNSEDDLEEEVDRI